MGPGRMAMMIERFEVYLVNLDPTQGREIQKTRSCLVISPNEIIITLVPSLLLP